MCRCSANAVIVDAKDVSSISKANYACSTPQPLLLHRVDSVMLARLTTVNTVIDDCTRPFTKGIDISIVGGVRVSVRFKRKSKAPSQPRRLTMAHRRHEKTYQHKIENKRREEKPPHYPGQSSAISRLQHTPPTTQTGTALQNEIPHPPRLLPPARRRPHPLLHRLPTPPPCQYRQRRAMGHRINLSQPSQSRKVQEPHPSKRRTPNLGSELGRSLDTRSRSRT
jgi:hypothetical protein